MKFNRLLKTIFLAEFVSGLFIAIKEIFKEKKTINYPVVGNASKKNKKLAVKTTHINESGRKIFQPSLINWSKRYLGTIAFTRENKINNPKILNIIQKKLGILLKG